MFIQSLPSGPFLTNAYILACKQTKEALIIDPGVDSYQPILDVINNHQFTPTAILLTHSHWDHIANVSKLKETLNIPVMIHQDDEANLITPGSDGLPMTPSFDGVTPDQYLKEHDEILVGESQFVVIHTPGHTPGGICLYSPKEKILISGDTLFKQSIGNLSFPTANPDKMWESLKKLEILPPETKVYPGHGPSTTIGEESWLPQAKQIFS
jgi:hydroxyacylglutathione hydrolase